MIDQFYSHGVDLAHFRCGPLASHIDGFAGYLWSQGYATQTARLKIRLTADLSIWLGRKHLGTRDVKEEQVDAFLETRKRELLLRRGDRRTLTQLLHYLRRDGSIPTPSAVLGDNPTDRIIRDYAHFLVEQRGLSQTTVANYAPIARRFMETRFGVEKPSLNKLG